MVVTRQKLSISCRVSTLLNRHIFTIFLPSFHSVRPEAKLFGPRKINEIVLSPLCKANKGQATSPLASDPRASEVQSVVLSYYEMLEDESN
ncbi:hypothetical protein Y032_0091g2419 [Ancylostoma ceylanicum]|uniref:Uncharacterized protein n=1 Tax=Ancylostoma ceylanicum TaxID=53326 RepID=A0A016TM84_9BILA|nr:hypothetical protein Y032_0091g2419 [Ancylostoma ceylanicum]